MTTTTEWNVDGEQYRVILNDELAATFTDVDAAIDFYNENACRYCRTEPVAHESHCCDIQQWTSEAVLLAREDAKS